MNSQNILDGAVVHSISDTARWVAYYRAQESRRRDALFNDPFAARLAGKTGEQIAHAMPRGEAGAWTMVVRTVLFDELIEKELNSGGYDAVINLAAGLDTRPFRMFLPRDIRWYEVDFKEILDYKAAQLDGVSPQCHYERVALDLSDVVARRMFFERVSRESKKVLIITEGLLLYLTEEQVRGLAKDIAAYRQFAVWLCDVISPLLLKASQRLFNKSLASANAKMQFGSADTRAFFDSVGWDRKEVKSIALEARRLGRRPKYANIKRFFVNLLPDRIRQQVINGATVIALARRAQPISIPSTDGDAGVNAQQGK